MPYIWIHHRQKLIFLKKPNLLLRVLNQEWTASAFIRDALFCLHLEGRANMHWVLLGEKGWTFVTCMKCKKILHEYSIIVGIQELVHEFYDFEINCITKTLWKWHCWRTICACNPNSWSSPKLGHFLDIFCVCVYE